MKLTIGSKIEIDGTKYFIEIFHNDLDLKKTFSKEIYRYLENSFVQKLNTSMSWGIFSLLLSTIENPQVKITDKMYLIAFYIELFIIGTDFLDDLMDKDNESFNQLSCQKPLTQTLLHYSLSKLSENVPDKSWAVFMQNLFLSLKYQSSESKKKLYFSSDEDSYFKDTVYRSVYLMNAIVQISISKPTKELFPFSYFLGASSQIKNDVANLYTHNPSDLVQRKPTLPIVKAFQELSTSHPFFPVYYTYQIDPSFNQFDKVKDYIKNSGSIEYSLFISEQCFNTALNTLRSVYPKCNVKTLQKIFIKRG